MIKIGIRREDKNQWERRVPLIPKDIFELQNNYNIKFIIQTSSNRIYKDIEYTSLGIDVCEDLLDCDIILAVKEIPKELLLKNKTYLYFSHVIKGQKYNMPMLRKLMELNSNLIDYEKITNDQGKRLIFFGKHAGIAGMIDSLWAFDQRIKSGFGLKKAYQYENISEGKKEIANLKKAFRLLDDNLYPIVCGFAGYGNVSQGAQEIYDLLDPNEISANELLNLKNEKELFKVVFSEKDLVKLKDGSVDFNLQDYYKYPEKYESQFDKYISKLSILINAIYWDKKYPRLITKNLIKKQKNLKLKVIGDISCDLNGAIELTEKVTQPDNPAFTYDALNDKIQDGIHDFGPNILSVDILPAEISKDSSIHFSQSLKKLIPNLIKANFRDENIENINLSDELKRALILFHGKLTKEYEYLNNYL